MDPRVQKVYPSAVFKRLVDNPNNYDGQVSMPFLIKMCFTKKQQYNWLTVLAFVISAGCEGCTLITTLPQGGRTKWAIITITLFMDIQ